MLEAKLTNGENDIMIAVKSGKAIRFPESKVYLSHRTARESEELEDDDEAIGMVCVEPNNANILVVSENGFGKNARRSKIIGSPIGAVKGSRPSI